MELTETASKIVKSKYSKEGKEDWSDICLRVAFHLASVEEKFGATEEEVRNLTGIFFSMIYNMYFIPGGRVLANAGTGIKSLMNCFVLPIGDSRDSIYGTLKTAAEIFAHGGGIGYNFSHVREEGAGIKTTKGRASGPLSFMTLFDQTGEVIQQASRRGAQMGMMNIDHPDIERFIDFKAEPNARNIRLLDTYDYNLRKYAEGRLKNTKYFDVLRKTLLDDQLTHFNISVVLTDEFMKAVEEDGEFKLNSVVGEEGKVVKARELLYKIAKQAWASGDPGIFFRNRTNVDNIAGYLGEIETTNPCGEVPLFPNEACCLGSINLKKFASKKGTIDLEALEDVVRASVRFLDNVQEVSELPIDEINKTCKGLRRLGLGVMGFADMLVELGIPYDSEDALKLADFLSWFISYMAWQESIDLARERGPFELYDKEKADLSVVERILNHPQYAAMKFDMEDVRNTGLRNVSVTSIAPTGSIALVAGVNSAIEPFFALAYRRYITEGVGNVAKDIIIEVNPMLMDKLKEAGLEKDDIKEVVKYVTKHGTLHGCPNVPQHVTQLFPTAHDLPWQIHLEMQARWQNFVTNAVSKTINMNNDVTVEDVYNAYIQAWKSGLKGMTIYRNGSRNFQILNVGVDENGS